MASNDLTPAPTEYLLEMARGLSDALGLSPHALFSPAHSNAAAAARAITDAVLFRDLDAALKATGMAEARAAGELPADQIYPARFSLQNGCSFNAPERQAPTRHTYQASYRDYAGWACKTERMAKWVAAWIARYLDPRDADNNPAANDIRTVEIGGETQWLAVRYSVKVPD